jgi:hypothetical protein
MDLPRLLEQTVTSLSIKAIDESTAGIQRTNGYNDDTQKTRSMKQEYKFSSEVKRSGH